jgi:hypothetical protein
MKEESVNNFSAVSRKKTTLGRAGGITGGFGGIVGRRRGDRKGFHGPGAKKIVRF